MINVLNSMKNRIIWYEKAIKMCTGEIKAEPNFEYPPNTVSYWEGAKHELENSIDMIEAAIKKATG